MQEGGLGLVEAIHRFDPTRLADLLGVDVAVVREMESRLAAREQSLNASPHEDGKARLEELATGDLPPDEQLAARETAAVLVAERDRFRETLDDRRRQLFDARWMTPSRRR